ncbi:MAG: ABC transporter permease [Phycisphaerae bacterium]
MRAYAAILSARFRLLLQYRAAAIAGFGTQLFWGLIRTMIFVAFYESATGGSGLAAGLSKDQTVSYVWLGQAFLLLIMLGVDGDVAAMIRNGNVLYELVKPLDLYGLWYCRMLAQRVTPTCLRAAPQLIFAMAVGWLQWPDWPTVLAFAACIVGAALLSAAVCMLMNISMFWTVSGVGVIRFIGAAAYLLGGIMLPLPMFPDSWQWVLNLQPFRGLGDAPFRLFIGNIPLGGFVGVVLHQLIWTAALVLLGRWLLARAMRRLVVQGG